MIKKVYNKTGWRIVVIFITLCVCVLVPFEALPQYSRRSKSKEKSSFYSRQKKPKTSAEAKKIQEETQREIKNTEEKIHQNELSINKGLAELGKLEQSITELNKKLNEINYKISRLTKEINTLETGIAENEKDLEILRAEYLKAVKKLRITKKNKSTLTFLFSSNSVNQAMRRMRYLREFSDWRDRQFNEINEKNSELKAQRDALATAQKEQANAFYSQKKAVAKLSSEHNRQEVIISNLKKNSGELQTYLKKKRSEADDLEDMVALLISEEQRKIAEEKAMLKFREEEARKRAESSNADATAASKETKNTEYADARRRTPRGSSGTGTETSNVNSPSTFADMRGKLPSPTSGSFTITSAFGRQTMADLPDVEYENPGIDAESDAGASARAVFNGKVSGVYILPGYNTVVILNHGNYYTVYGNIASPSVKIGDQVEEGTSLGKLTLNEEDQRRSSIHFEVWKNREKLNPQDWLK